MYTACRIAALVILGVISAGLAKFSHANATPSGLTLERVADLRWLDDAQISPDGKSIAYQVRFYDMDGDEYWRSDLYTVEVATGRQTLLASRASQARWSLDGKRLLWIGLDTQGREQLFVKVMGSAQAPQQLTSAEQSPSAAVWSPDGTQVAFSRFIPDTRDPWPLALPPPRSARADRGKAPIVIDDVQWAADGAGVLPRGETRIFTIDSTGKGNEQQRTQGRRLINSVIWSADSKQLIFDGLDRTDFDRYFTESYIYQLDLSSGKIRVLSKPPTQANAYFHSVQASPDGAWLAFQGYEWTDFHRELASRVWVMRPDGSELRCLTADQLAMPRPETLVWHPQNKGLYFQAPIKSHADYFFVDLEGKLQALRERADSLIFTRSVARSGLVAGEVGSAINPGDLAVFPVAKPQQARVLVPLNPQLRDQPVGSVRRLEYRSKDGTPMIGLLRLPPGFDPQKKYPMILRADGLYFYPSFNAEQWNWVADGYVVLGVHHRADEAAHGLDKKHVNFNFNGYLNQETVDDILTGVDAALQLGFIDEKRLFIGGSSQGGSLSAFTITQTQRFAAASVMRPTTSAIAWAYGKGALDAYQSFAKPFWEDLETWVPKSSVLYHAHRTQTPVLIMTGEEDWDVTVSESDQYYRVLKLHTQAPVRYVRMPGVHHGWGENFATFARLQRYTLEWFKRWDSKHEKNGQ
jgi:dipeptidyl aminopeptidase/acylaminoacyl peptidase